MPVCARSIKFGFSISINGVGIQLDGYIKLLKFYFFLNFFLFSMNCFWLLFPMLLVAQSCPLMTTGSPLDDPMECRPPGSSVHGVLQARILECVAISSSRDLLHPGIKPACLLSLGIYVSCVYH